MLSLRFWIGIYVIIIGLLISIFYGANRYIAGKIVERVPVQLNQTLPAYVQVHYTDLKNEKCAFSFCLSAQNVAVTFPGSLSGQLVTLHFGKVKINRSVMGYYQVKSNGIMMQKYLDKTLPIQVRLSAQTDLKDITLTNLSLNQNQFQAQISGNINRKIQQINLTGKSIGLAQFASQFIPQNFRFLMNLALKNTEQNITITSDEKWVKLLNIPIMPKHIIFKQKSAQ